MTTAHELMLSTRDANSIDNLNMIMARHFDNLGFDKYAYVLVNNPLDPSLNNSYVSNFPSQWEQRYTERNYFNVDPLYDLFKQKKQSFSWGWSSQKEFLNIEQKKFFWEANDFGTDKGVGVPIFSPCGGFSIVSLCSSYIEEDELEKYLKSVEKDLISASLIHHQTTLKLKTEKKDLKDYNLSEKEFETLYWMCKGKTYEEIALILKVSREGISDRISRIYKKMGVFHRSDAIAIAIASKMITL